MKLEMTLEEHLAEIQSGLRSGSFPNEAAISQGVVIRVLQALNWPVFDAQIVFPQYGVAGRRADYALCHPRTKPVVFIEVKQLGHSEGADQQLFTYAYHEGVPMAVLTDGQEWNFYLPAERGHYDERRVYKLDLLERKLDESGRIFRRYLTYDDVCSGKAMETAKTDYKDVARQRDIKRTLPDAWAALSKEKDGKLIDLVAEKTESMCGFRPDKKILEDFLISKEGRREGPSPGPKSPGHGTREPMSKPKGSPPGTKTSTDYIIRGQTFTARNAMEVVVEIFTHLADIYPDFLERYDALPKHGRTRRYLARSPDRLNPRRPDLVRDYSREIVSDWWIDTNVSNNTKRKMLELACECVGLKLGEDVIIYF